ncbi:hypothetical protein ABL78_2492 [Leptomonas seymouri]|uniref:Uncharacterized protein n=1 Tax=Leptomonas seymouri TaxID=5684 RepID=A0A0N0P7J5_LEPSE|nr:hypothetical protein ABL78_2492 [Leptomonas seymouri]|eukprot:KPI88427.1 hypothetical protein ABL78_2492 [Leptomonas seymouri]
MYSFSLKPTGRERDPATAPPPPANVIRAPSEMQRPPAKGHEHDSTSHHRLPSVPQPASRALGTHGTQASPQNGQRAPAAPSTGTPTSRPPSPQLQPPSPPVPYPSMQVHSISAYSEMRDAADWSVAIQRERAEKRQRAIAQHEAAKAEERRLREEAEAQSKRELQRRKEERQQLRKAMKEDDEIADFQERDTQLLKNQQRLIDLSAAMVYAEQQRKARAREEIYQTWTHSRAGTSAFAMTTASGTLLPSTAASSHAVKATATSSTAIPSKETELRQAALRTEDAYVQLSLAYRSEAHRSRAAADILAAASANSGAKATPPTDHSCIVSPSAVSATITTTPMHAPAPIAPLPFRTAPQMYSHDSDEHMGPFARDIPTTYIPEYFDDSKGKTLSVTAAAKPVVEEVMPLPLSPVPVSQAVSNTLRETYYPWAALADSRTASLKQNVASRDAYLPVQRWGKQDLQSTIYGHNVNPDGTMQEPCERRKDFMAYLNYTTLPVDNATATSNAPETIPPYHFGKRVEVWM